MTSSRGRRSPPWSLPAPAGSKPKPPPWAATPCSLAPPCRPKPPSDWVSPPASLTAPDGRKTYGRSSTRPGRTPWSCPASTSAPPRCATQREDDSTMPAIVEMRLRPSRPLEPTTRQLHGLACAMFEGPNSAGHIGQFTVWPLHPDPDGWLLRAAWLPPSLPHSVLAACGQLRLGPVTCAVTDLALRPARTPTSPPDRPSARCSRPSTPRPTSPRTAPTSSSPTPASSSAPGAAAGTPHCLRKTRWPSPTITGATSTTPSPAAFDLRTQIPRRGPRPRPDRLHRHRHPPRRTRTRPPTYGAISARWPASPNSAAPALRPPTASAPPVFPPPTISCHRTVIEAARRHSRNLTNP